MDGWRGLHIWARVLCDTARILNRGRLTPQIMLQNLSNHENYPLSICSHRDKEYHTTACVIAEPTRGLLHVARGAPCQNWPVTYKL